MSLTCWQTLSMGQSELELHQGLRVEVWDRDPYGAKELMVGNVNTRNKPPSLACLTV